MQNIENIKNALTAYRRGIKNGD